MAFKSLGQINRKKGKKTHQNNLWMNKIIQYSLALCAAYSFCFSCGVGLPTTPTTVEMRMNSEHSTFSSFGSVHTAFRCPLQLCFTVIVLKQMMNQIGDTKSIHSLPNSLFVYFIFFFASFFRSLVSVDMVEQQFYGVYVHFTRASTTLSRA